LVLSTGKSNNFLQFINFRMPERDVLLFLTTETNFMLSVFISENSEKIIRAEHEGIPTHYTTRHIPIIIQHYRDNEIVIEIWFNDPFAEIDREDLRMQLSDVDDIRFNDGERIYTPFFGYDTAEVCDEIVSLRYNIIDSDAIREEQWYSFLQREGDGIRITVHFLTNSHAGDRNIYEIDVDFLRSQLSNINVSQRVLANEDDISQGFVGNTQIIRFPMPSHNVDLVIRVKSLLRLLTVRPQAFQFMDRDPRRIEGVLHEGTFHEFGIGLIGALEGISLPIISREPVVDLFIRFHDIYMHLDRDFLTSQEPRLAITEAGEFVTASSLQPPLQIPSQVLNDPEFFQHVRVTMTENDLVLIMRWVERLYRINYVIQNAFFVSNEIRDTNVLANLDNNGRQVPLPQFIMPHYTYSRIVYNGNIIQNPVQITSQLLPSMQLDTVDSNYVLTRGIGLGDAIPLNAPDSIVIPGGMTPNFDLTFDMPRFNITFNLHIKIADNTIVLSHFIAAVNRTFLLMPGRYRMWLSGADGGHGAPPSYFNLSPFGYGSVNTQEGSAGAGNVLDITVTRITTLHFNLGRRGNNAVQGSGNSSGSGGGGGGTSLLDFSSPVGVRRVDTNTLLPNVRRVFVIGGNGGRGSDNQWRINTPSFSISRWGVNFGMSSSPIGQHASGGAAGIGGGHPDNPDPSTGNGSIGGESSGWGTALARGSPGAGGAGFSILSATDVSGNPIPRPGYVDINGTPVGDGWLVIQYLSRY